MEINASCMTQSASAEAAALDEVRANGAAPKRRGDAREKESGTRIWRPGVVKRTKTGRKTNGVLLSRLEQIAQQDRHKT